MTQPATETQQTAAQANPEQEQAEKERQEKDAKSRIQELSRRNSELERLLNMDQRLQQVESRPRTVEAPKRTKEQEEWEPFMRPKVDPLLEEKLGPVRAALFQLADQNDLLHTMMTYPEYKDEEVQREVEGIRHARQQQTGQIESRGNVLVYLRGRNPEKFSASRGEKQQEQQSEGRQAVHVEGRSSVGTTRANAPATKNAEDATVEEMEKWMTENKFKF